MDRGDKKKGLSDECVDRGDKKKGLSDECGDRSDKEKDLGDDRVDPGVLMIKKRNDVSHRICYENVNMQLVKIIPVCYDEIR